MKIGLLGKKIGMTRFYDDKGKATPVTVIEAGGNTALQIKTEASDGYSSVQVGFVRGETTKAQMTLHRRLLLLLVSAVPHKRKPIQN